MLNTGHTCADCGAEIMREDGSFAIGFGVDDAGNTHCYACCGKEDERIMRETGRHSGLYLTGNWTPWRKDATVSNWPGTLRFPVITANHSERGGGFGCQRTDAWFRGPDGFIWHAVNRGDMQLARCRRTKRTSL